MKKEDVWYILRLVRVPKKATWVFELTGDRQQGKEL